MFFATPIHLRYLGVTYMANQNTMENLEIFALLERTKTLLEDVVDINDEILKGIKKDLPSCVRSDCKDLGEQWIGDDLFCVACADMIVSDNSQFEIE